MPNSKRPFETRSRVATSLAVTIGSRSVSRQMPVPRRRLLVTAAAAARPTNGSSVCEYAAAARPARPRRPATDRDVRVLGHEQRFEAALLERPGDLDDGHRVVGGEIVEPDLHRRALLPSGPSGYAAAGPGGRPPPPCSPDRSYRAPSDPAQSWSALPAVSPAPTMPPSTRRAGPAAIREQNPATALGANLTARRKAALQRQAPPETAAPPPAPPREQRRWAPGIPEL